MSVVDSAATVACTECDETIHFTVTGTPVAFGVSTWEHWGFPRPVYGSAGLLSIEAMCKHLHEQNREREELESPIMATGGSVDAPVYEKVSRGRVEGIRRVRGKKP